jgi:hypothetical protein
MSVRIPGSLQIVLGVQWLLSERDCLSRVLFFIIISLFMSPLLGHRHFLLLQYTNIKKFSNVKIKKYVIKARVYLKSEKITQEKSNTSVKFKIELK